jgi:hypothetical protein
MHNTKESTSNQNNWSIETTGVLFSAVNANPLKRASLLQNSNKNRF